MIKEMLKMTYDECCYYLKSKYGNITGNYFLKDNFKTINQKIKKTQLGLFIHHIDEDKAIMLSEPKYAAKNPFEYQLANRLVYCNYLEHLVLHIKIMQYPNKIKKSNEIVGYGGAFNFIIPELNDIYSGITYKKEWKNKTAEIIKDYYDEYLLCIEYIISNFNFSLEQYLSSYNHKFKAWNVQNNINVFKDIHKIYLKYNSNL